MPLANIADGALALYVLKKLVTPWIQTDAFRLGLIDADGTLLRSPKEPEEKSAYTLLDRLVFNLKRILKLCAILRLQLGEILLRDFRTKHFCAAIDVCVDSIAIRAFKPRSDQRCRIDSVVDSDLIL